MILVPVLLHAAWAVGVVSIHTYTHKDIALPSTIVPISALVVLPTD
jgi:hypothetical protein